MKYGLSKRLSSIVFALPTVSIYKNIVGNDYKSLAMLDTNSIILGHLMIGMVWFLD